MRRSKTGRRGGAERRGSTLIESVLALVCFLIILQASLDFFGTARAVFAKLEDGLSARESAQAALERIRQDVLAAGQGLEEPIARGLAAGIAPDGAGTSILSVEEKVSLAADARAGDASLAIPDAGDFSVGRIVVLQDKADGELATVTSVAGNTLALAAPLGRSYAAADAELLLLRKVAYFFDAASSVLRRKVNTSSAQPLLEDTASFSMSVPALAGLVKVSLALQERLERSYEISIFPRNLALARVG